MSEKLYQLEDAKSERVVFVGTEKECIEYTKEEPYKKFTMTERKAGGNYGRYNAN